MPLQDDDTFLWTDTEEETDELRRASPRRPLRPKSKQTQKILKRNGKNSIKIISSIARSCIQI